MKTKFSYSPVHLSLCLIYASLCGISVASEESDRAEIRDASGRYNGVFSGTSVIGEDASSIDAFESSSRMPRKKGKFTSRLLFEKFGGPLRWKAT